MNRYYSEIIVIIKEANIFYTLFTDDHGVNNNDHIILDICNFQVLV